VRDITGDVSGAEAVNWVQGVLPPSAETGSTGPVPTPSGVIAGSQYEPGQQLRVYSSELNVRAGPGYSYDFVRNFLVAGEYVRILAGPVEAEGGVWWQVQTADGSIGWIAGEINGSATIGP
jgi:SH3-like domain-containing protein